MEAIKYIALYVVFLLVIWGVSVFMADTVSKHELIYPQEGIACVVVSRSFNTSIDCWNDKREWTKG